MIKQNGLSDQLPNEIQSAFNELQIIQHLRKAGVFYHKNWFQLLESNKGESFPGKDAVYRFLNHSCYAWRFSVILRCSYHSKSIYFY